jgi:hypothetical protein
LVTKDEEDRGKQAAVDGIAHEHIVLAELMKRYHNVSLIDLPLSKYDLVLVITKENEEEDIIRVQIKTAKKSIPFGGGTRGGQDREYKSGVKKFRHNSKTADVIIGVTPNDKGYDLYFVPTILVDIIDQDSISIKKIEGLKFNHPILKNCKNKEFVMDEMKKYGIAKDKL